jgi:hypothetical protein
MVQDENLKSRGRPGGRQPEEPVSTLNTANLPLADMALSVKAFPKIDDQAHYRSTVAAAGERLQHGKNSTKRLPPVAMPLSLVHS